LLKAGSPEARRPKLLAKDRQGRLVHTGNRRQRAVRGVKAPPTSRRSLVESRFIAQIPRGDEPPRSGVPERNWSGLATGTPAQFRAQPDPARALASAVGARAVILCATMELDRCGRFRGFFASLEIDGVEENAMLLPWATMNRAMLEAHRGPISRLTMHTVTRSKLAPFYRESRASRCRLPRGRALLDTRLRRAHGDTASAHLPTVASPWRQQRTMLPVLVYHHGGEGAGDSATSTRTTSSAASSA
jgi:hypothetical protein